MPGLEAAKTYAALVGAIATALLGVFTGDTTVGKVLTVVAVIATAVVTFRVPNRDPKALHQDESVQPPYQGRHEAGQVDPWTLILGIIALAVVLWFLFIFLPALMAR